MRKNAPYRVASALMVVVFALFNVGLPVVIDACPMPKMTGSMTCALCHPAPVRGGDPPVVQSPRCCSPVLAAERNTTAFVPSQKIADEFRFVAHAVIAPSPSPAAVTVCPLEQLRPSSWSPPERDADLPILHSALLI